jgi:uncharacterized OB-fold protein
MPIVYTETVIHSAPESFAAEAPYQIAIIEFEDGRRELVRIEGERVAIGDSVSPTPNNRYTKSPA